MSNNNEISAKLREISKLITDLQENEDIEENPVAWDGLERALNHINLVQAEFGDGAEDLLFYAEDDDEEEDDEEYEEEEEGEPLF